MRKGNLSECCEIVPSYDLNESLNDNHYRKYYQLAVSQFIITILLL